MGKITLRTGVGEVIADYCKKLADNFLQI